MKKTLAILLSVVLILAMVPMSAMVGAEMSTEEIWNQFFTTSDGATVTDCTVAAGSITFTATLPSDNGYVQLNQKLTDLFDGAKFTVGTTSSAESCYLQLTDDATAATDIVPVAENGTDPGTDGMSWLILKSGNFVVLGRGANTNGTGSRLSTYGRFNSTTGIENITFSKVDGKVAISAPEFTTSNIQCGFTDYAPSTKTAEEVGLADGGYFRLRNRDAAERTFTVTVKSKDISPAYKDGDFILSDLDSKVNSSTVTYADGKATYTYNVTLATKDSYVQLDKKLSDLLTDAKFTVGTNSSAETCYLQLTADATAKTDIVPVNEFGGVDPGTVGMTWLIYKSGNFVVFGRGVNPNGLGSRLSTYGRFSGDGIADITFGKVDGDKIAVSAPEFTTSGYNCGFTDYAPSTKTAEEVGLTDGGYFRLRNRDGGTHTFTVSITTKDTQLRPITVTGGTANVETAAYGDSVTLIPGNAPEGYKFAGWNVVSGGVTVENNAFTMGSAPVEIEAVYEELPIYTDGNYILSDRDSKIVDSSVTYANGKASYTATVELSTKDSYVQFNKKLTDLFNGANFTVATNSSAETCYLQLTADATAATDIVPVNEFGGVDPGTVGMTWLIYKSGNYVVFGRGINPNGLGAKISTYGRFSGDLGIYDITFGKVDGDKVAVSAPEFTSGVGFTDYAPSNKTAEEVSLTDGGYFRLRNRDNGTHTFTFTITTADTEVRPITVTGGTASVETAGYGASVTLTHDQPELGYKFAGWKVVSGGVEIVDNAFIMGSEPVEIEAIFEESVYADGDYILSDHASKLISSSVTYANGKASYTATVELSTKDSYVQFNKKLTDLFNGANFTVATNSSAENCYLQLTADATAETDIVPVNEYGGVNPGTVGMTWLIYKSGNFVVMGRGINPNGLGSKLSTYGRFSGDGIANIRFGKVDGDKVAISADKFVAAGNDCGFDDYAPSTNTAEEVGLTDGGYFRLRNRDGGTHTFTFTVTTADTETRAITVKGGKASVETAGYGASVALTPDEAPRGYKFAGWNVVSGGVEIVENAFTMGSEPVEIEAVYEETTYTDGNYIVSDPNSNILSSSVERENGKISYTATVELSGKGSYVQLNEKATGLIGGSDTVKVTIGENADINDYYNSNFYIQLTADASGNDIVPKDDSASAPNTDAISFRLFGYNNQYVMYTNKVASGAGAKYYTNRINNSNYYTEVTNGMTVIFPENADDNKVQIRNSRNDLVNAGVAGIYTSNQTAADINGQDGVYVRIRNDKDETVVYTFTVTTADPEAAHTVTVTGGKASVDTAATGATVTLTPDEAATGYKFAGWNVVSGGVEIADNAFVMGTENVVVEAVFEKIAYSVTVDGEEFGVANYGDTVTLTVPSADNGFTFSGWNVVSGGVEIVDNAFVMGTENVVIESTFEAVDYTVTIDGAAQDVVYNIGDTITLTPVAPTDSYVEFDKWVIVTGEGASIEGNVLTVGYGNVEVKATFKAAEPFGDIRDLVRYDEVGADAPGVGGAFKALYTALDNVFNFSTIRNFLLGK